jgi:hypothetical protein
MNETHLPEVEPAPFGLLRPHVLDKAVDLSDGSDERFEKQLRNEEPLVQRALREEREQAKQFARETLIPVGFDPTPLSDLVQYGGGRSKERLRQIAQRADHPWGPTYRIGTGPLLVNGTDGMRWLLTHPYKPSGPKGQRIKR